MFWFRNFFIWSLLYITPCAHPCQPQCTQSSPTGPHQLPRYDNIPVSLPATEYNWETAGEMFWQNETLHSIGQFVIVYNFSLSNDYTLPLFQMSYLFQEIASSNATVVFIGPRCPASTRSSLSSNNSFMWKGWGRGIFSFSLSKYSPIFSLNKFPSATAAPRAVATSGIAAWRWRIGERINRMMDVCLRIL